MAINLASKYEKKVAEKFTQSSFVKGNTSNAYNFEGVKSIHIYTPQTIDLTNYTRTGTNRFGAVTEMQDEIQTLTLTRDRSFALSIDRGNNEDQMLIKEAGKMMKMQLDEKAIPEFDKYAIGTFIEKGGQSKEITSAPTKSSITGLVFDAATALDNALVPSDNRILYVPSSIYNMLRLSDEFIRVDKLAGQILTKGVMGEIAEMKVVKVPDIYFPRTNGTLNAYFLITYKGSVLNPLKIKTTRILKEVMGIDGAVLEGRFYYDAFVLGAKADGVYSALKSGTKATTPVISTGSGSTTITASNCTIYYTTDGTDPRYSPTKQTYSSALSLTSGIKLRAYAERDGYFNSDVAESVIA